MITGMVRCQECGRWYFNWKKLWRHLIERHDYEIKLDEDEEEEAVEEPILALSPLERLWNWLKLLFRKVIRGNIS